MTPDPSKGLCIREVWSVFVGERRLPQRGSILHIKHVQRIMDKIHSLQWVCYDGSDLHLELETFQTGLNNDGAKVIKKL